MPVLSYGPISVTSMVVRTEASLEELLAVMRQRKPSNDTLEPGWGALGDDVSHLRDLGAPQPSAGTPQVVEGDDELPRRLEARTYWWEIDRPTMRRVGEQHQREAMRLEAADVLMYSSGENEFIALASTRRDPQLRAEVRPQMVKLLEDSGYGGTVSIDELPHDMEDSDDFFFWLVYRSLKQPAIDESLSIRECFSAKTQDESTRTASLSRGVQMDRGDLLALAMQETIVFGPVKLALFDSSLGLHLMVEIADAGDFSIVKGETEFIDPPEGEEEEYLNALYVLLFAYHVFPRLANAFHADTDWSTQGRDEFRAECRRLMHEATS